MSRIQQSRNQRKTPWALIIALLLILAAEGAFLLLLKPEPPAYIDESEKETASSSSAKEKIQEKERYSILLLGIDGEGSRTDAIMLVNFDNSRYRLSLVSIPRDTLIYRGSEPMKLNALYGTEGCGTDGVRAIADHLRERFGVVICGHILVELDGFVSLIDELGGIRYSVPQRMYYFDPAQNLTIDLQPGEQLLDGKQAMGLVRYRQYLFGDIDRTVIQQDFLRSAAKQLAGKLSPMNLHDYRRILESSVQTDLSFENLTYFASKLLLWDMDAIESATLPGQSKIIQDIDYYKLDEESSVEILTKYCATTDK